MLKQHSYTNKLIIGVSTAFLFSTALISSNAIAAKQISIEAYNKQYLANSSTADGVLKNLDDAYQFKNVKKVVLDNGDVRYKLVQYYQNIPVWNTTVVSNREDVRNSVHTDTLRGDFLINIEDDISSVKANISKFQAEQSAIAAAKVTNISQVRNINSDVYVKNYTSMAKLVYIVDFFVADEKNPSRPYVIIDAINGDILEQWNGLATADGQATGPGGNEKTGKYFYGKDYGFLPVTTNGTSCTMESKNVASYDLQNKQDDTGGVLFKFTCPDNAYKTVNGAYSPINDAHYFGNVVFDLYSQWYKTAPLKFKILMKVHYGTKYENAYFNGKEMVFGDGDKMFYPLVSVDVVGHEISHGFTEQNSGLTYKNQSGGMNEAFSDMAGEATQYFHNLNKPEAERNDWLVGEEIFKGDRGKAMRYFDDPTKDGYSIGDAKDYDPKNNEVHSTSGVYNKAFYLLAHKPNWNLKKAFDAFVLANQTYWTQDATFDTGACGVKHAATDLGYDENDVISAFKEVSVDASCGSTPPDPTPNPDPTPTPPVPDQATKLDKAVPYYGLSGSAGTSKLFYIDIKENKVGVLSTWNFGGIGSPDMIVAYNRVPSSSDYDCQSSVEPNNAKSCYIFSPKAGRYYIKVTGTAAFRDVILWSSYL